LAAQGCSSPEVPCRPFTFWRLSESGKIPATLPIIAMKQKRFYEDLNVLYPQSSVMSTESVSKNSSNTAKMP
jgi:hypothetical protein